MTATSTMSSQQLTSAIDALLNLMGKPSAQLFVRGLKSKYGINIENITSPETQVVLEFALRHMFGAGSDMLIRFLRREMER